MNTPWYRAWRRENFSEDFLLCEGATTESAVLPPKAAKVAAAATAAAIESLAEVDQSEQRRILSLSHEVSIVTVPEGAKGGDIIHLNAPHLSKDHMFAVTVPSGMKAGDEFDALIPRAATAVSTRLRSTRLPAARQRRGPYMSLF